MDKEYLQPISTEHGELAIYRDWDCEGAIYMENARTINRYIELSNPNPNFDDYSVFTAFSKQQYDEGYNHLLELGKITKDDVIYRCGAGIYGTHEGLERLGNFYQNVENKIASECDPQEVYFYEWNNHECMFSNDEEAFEAVKRIFGEERANKITRI